MDVLILNWLSLCHPLSLLYPRQLVAFPRCLLHSTPPGSLVTACPTAPPSCLKDHNPYLCDPQQGSPQVSTPLRLRSSCPFHCFPTVLKSCCGPTMSFQPCSFSTWNFHVPHHATRVSRPSLVLTSWICPPRQLCWDAQPFSAFRDHRPRYHPGTSKFSLRKQDCSSVCFCLSLFKDVVCSTFNKRQAGDDYLYLILPGSTQRHWVLHLPCAFCLYSRKLAPANKDPAIKAHSGAFYSSQSSLPADKLKLVTLFSNYLICTNW